jgi:hypothetical protein
MTPSEQALIQRQRAARLEKEEREAAIEAKRMKDAHSAPGFFDNIDTSGGLDACHPWTGERKWNHTETGGEKVKGYEHGVFEYDGCDSFIHTRVLCYAIFGQQVPRDMDVIPICGDHLCSNIRHMCIGPHGGNRDCKLAKAAPAEEFFCSKAA